MKQLSEAAARTPFCQLAVQTTGTTSVADVPDVHLGGLFRCRHCFPAPDRRGDAIRQGRACTRREVGQRRAWSTADTAKCTSRAGLKSAAGALKDSWRRHLGGSAADAAHRRPTLRYEILFS